MLKIALLSVFFLACGGIVEPNPSPPVVEPPIDAQADSVEDTQPDVAPKIMACRIVFDSTIVDRACATYDGGPPWEWRNIPGDDDAGWIGCELALCKPGDRCRLRSTLAPQGVCVEK